MKVAILSGKGGTGKSSFASSLALEMSKKNMVLVDADVDCPNQHILFPGEILRKEPLYVSKTAVFDESKHIFSHRCAEVCRFGAIRIINSKAVIDRLKCEGCGACVLVCPDAIKLMPKLGGELIVKETKHFPLVYGKLEPGESGSGKVVFEVKKAAESIAKERGTELTIIDAPAGIGCPVIAALTGCDYAVGVVEPTPASIANLKRALEVVRHFNIPFSVVINKAGISETYEKKITVEFGEALIAQVPYDEEIPRLLAQAIPPIKGKGAGAKGFKKAVKAIEKKIFS
ncbi:ATP-binding protein [Candidatus Micrarchaeota archaeon]|nr:ATP-binding protein [Candidatus Micrarchaeota archaeon]